MFMLRGIRCQRTLGDSNRIIYLTCNHIHKPYFVIQQYYRIFLLSQIHNNNMRPSLHYQDYRDNKLNAIANTCQKMFVHSSNNISWQVLIPER